MQSVSSYYSIQHAEKTISSALKANRLRIIHWANWGTTLALLNGCTVVVLLWATDSDRVKRQKKLVTLCAWCCLSKRITGSLIMFSRLISGWGNKPEKQYPSLTAMLRVFLSCHHYDFGNTIEEMLQRYIDHQ